MSLPEPSRAVEERMLWTSLILMVPGGGANSTHVKHTSSKSVSVFRAQQDCGASVHMVNWEISTLHRNTGTGARPYCVAIVYTSSAFLAPDAIHHRLQSQGVYSLLGTPGLSKKLILVFQILELVFSS